MKKQPEITEKTKDAFVTAFCQLYAQKPIDKITIKEITLNAGYNRSTFYQYFSDVYDLLEYIENDLLKSMIKSLETTHNSGFSPDLNRLIEFLSDKEIYLKALLSDYGSMHFISKIKATLPHDILHRAFPGLEYIAPYLFEFHLSTTLSLFRTWLHNGKDISAKELCELIHELYTRGVSSVEKQ